MDIIFAIAPLYLIAFFGYISKKVLRVSTESVSKILIYIVSPVVVFYGIYKVELSYSNLSIPLLFFILSALSSWFCYVFSSRYLNRLDSNVLSYLAGLPNIGFFALPIIILLFDDQVFSKAVLAVFGVNLYANTLGFYLLSRGHFNHKETINKLLRLPAVYCFLIGFLFNFFDVHFIERVLDYIIAHFKGSYTLLGMMLVGMGVSDIKSMKVDYRFLITSLSFKFLIYPLLLVAIIVLDDFYFKFYSKDIYQIILVFLAVPIGASSIAYTTELGIGVRQTAIAVYVSTILAIFLIPLIISIFITDLPHLQ